MANVREAFIRAEREFAHEATCHLQLDHASHRENLPSLLGRRRGDKGPTLRFHADQTLLHQLEQGLSHQGA